MAGIYPNTYVNQFSGQYDWLGGNEGVMALKAMVASGANGLADIRKASYITGTPPGSSPGSAGAGFVNFIPEDLLRFWTAETRGNRQIVASKRLQKVSAISTEQLYDVVTDYGQSRYIADFQSETGLVASTTATVTQGTAVLKQHANRTTITGTSMIVGYIGGVNAMGVAQVTRDGLSRALAFGTKAKAVSHERATLFGDATVNALEFNGVVTQCIANGTAGQNVFDLRGQPLTWARVLTDVGNLADTKYGAMTDEIWLSGGQWASLMISTSDGGRWSQDTSASITPLGKGWVYNPARAGIVGPMGQFIALVVVPFLGEMTNEPIPDAAVGTPAQAVTIANQTSAVAGGSNSQFTVDDEGDYAYGVLAVFQDGSSAPYFTADIPVTAGQNVTITMNDAAIGTADNPLYSYELWRTDVGADHATAKFMARYPVKNSGGHTVMVDSNAVIPGTENVLPLQHSEGGIYSSVLLDPVRFPIPVTTYVGVSQVILSIETPVVAHPNRQIVYQNAGFNS